MTCFERLSRFFYSFYTKNIYERVVYIKKKYDFCIINCVYSHLIYLVQTPNQLIQ